MEKFLVIRVGFQGFFVCYELIIRATFSSIDKGNKQIRKEGKHAKTIYLWFEI